jgi:hypothetical protein
MKNTPYRCPKFYFKIYIRNPKEEIITNVFWIVQNLIYIIFMMGQSKMIITKKNFGGPHN